MTARVQTELEAANLALDEIGEPPIGDLSENSARARACNRWFGAVRDELQREHDWNFCSAWVQPAMDPVAAIGPLKNRYPLPDDCLKVRDVMQQTGGLVGNAGISITDPTIIAEIEASPGPLIPGDLDWAVEAATVNPGETAGAGMMLVTRYTAPLVNYTRSITIPRLWDTQFVGAFVKRLAARVAPGIAKDINAGEKKSGEADALVEKAATQDSQEEGRRTVSRDTSWIGARFVGVARRSGWGR